MLSEEKANQIKEHLLKQVSNFPEEKQEQIKEQIASMTNEQLEEFIKQNQLTHLDSENEQQKSQDCIFCLIVNEKVPSYKLEENKYALGILEINPLSKGHSLIIQKMHQDVTKIPSSAFSLAKKIAKKIKSKYKPQEIQISSKNMFGHGVIEIIPLYGNEKERHKASEEDLLQIQDDLKTVPKITPQKTSNKKIKARKTKKLPVLKQRIP